MKEHVKDLKNLTAAFALKYIEEVVENLLTHLCILFLVNSCSLTNVQKKIHFGIRSNEV